MFKRHKSSYPNFSTRLQSELRLWNVSPLCSRLETVIGIRTLCVDVSSQLFAVGTSGGEIRVYDNQFKETILVTPKHAAVNILQFARPRDFFKLLCIDNDHTLHVWNLDIHGIPTLETSKTLNGPIYRIGACSAHSHAFLAVQSGEILIFDLINMKLSTYRIPYTFDERHPSPAIDVALLPHKLNQLIIGYSDGAILYDLISREVVAKLKRELNSGKNKDSPLTTLAIHPAGQHCATGYEDGMIYIWDISSSQMVWNGSLDRTRDISGANAANLEPVYKMEWTGSGDPDGSLSSWLTVCGGLPQSGDIIDGTTVLRFKAELFQQKNMEHTIAPEFLHYPTCHPVQDFAILSARSSANNLLFQILTISGDGDQAVAIDAFPFPPRIRSPDGNSPLENKTMELEFSADLEESEERSRNLAATLEDFKSELQDEEKFTLDIITPERLPLPFPLYSGWKAPSSSEMISLNHTEYLRLVRQSEDETTLGSKRIQYRILMSQHEDASLTFHDVSVLPGLNLSLHPRPLDHLMIRVLEIPEIALRPNLKSIRVSNVEFARESLECVIHLSTGEIIALGLGRRPRTQDVLDDEIIDLSDVRDQGDVFTPRFLLKAQRGDPTIVCLSNIGFLAVAFQHGLIMVIDMRGPKIIFRDLAKPTSRQGEVNTVVSLSWVVSGAGDDDTLAPRLLAIRKDGSLSIHPLLRVDGSWTVDSNHTTRHLSHSLPSPVLSVVLDAQTGKDCRATPSRLAYSFNSDPDLVRPSGTHSFWVVANRKEIRVHANIIGDKVSKISFSPHDSPNYISLVNAHDSVVLVAFLHERVVVYSLPILEAIHTFPLPVTLQPKASLLCTAAGDVLQTCRSPNGGMNLIFTSLLEHSKSSASGFVNFKLHKYVKPLSSQTAQNTESQAWGFNVGDWIKAFTEQTPVTGDDIDTILTDPVVISESYKEPTKMTAAGSSVESKDKKPSTDKKSDKKSATSNPPSLAAWGQGMYQQLASAAVERGERLGELQEHFQHLESGSRDLATQARKAAEKQAVKRWFF